MRGLDYHERCQMERGQRQRHGRNAMRFARMLLLGASSEVQLDLEALDLNPFEAPRLAWRIYRDAVRALDRETSDRLEWRGRCHRINGRFEQVEWPGGQSTRHTVPLRERARCLLMGRDYPIAGPSGRLP